jgi:GPH family glycoside/pentoside/hexuronide:cation symporter
MYNTAHALMVPLSSRNSVERTGLSTFSNIGMMAGQLIISAIFPTFVYSNIGLDKKLWFFAMLGFALLAFPMELCEYFFTKERVTQEQEKNEIKEEKIKTSAQLKVCVKDKYWWLMMLYFLFFYLGLAMKNASVNYYCDWVLGKPQDSTTIMLFNVVGGSSIFLGLFIIGALQKKFTKRSQLMVGFIFYSLGDLLCWIFPTNLPVVLVGQFIKNAGAIPCIFIVLSLYSDVLDHLEWKAGFRCDGVSTAIYSIMVIFFPILGTSVFNKLLYSFGYDSSLTSQSTSCQQMLTACCVGVETITAAIIAVLFVFFDVEKGLKEKQAEIINRQKEKVLAQGGTWIDPAERAKQEQADLEKAREEERVAALKEKCQKKGLDYEKEEAAYQTKKQAKETKKKGKK